MKKIKAFLAFAIAVSMCVSTAACGKTNDSEKDDTEEKVTTTAAAEESEEEEVTTTTAATTTTTAETTAEPEPEPVVEDNSAYEYYEDLNAEFQAHGLYSYDLLCLKSDGMDGLPGNQGSPYYRNGKVYFLVTDEEEGNKIIAYDVNTKKVSEHSIDGSIDGYPKVNDGKLLLDSFSSDSLIDIETGKIIGSYSNDLGSLFLPSGASVYYWNDGDGEIELRYYSPDSETIAYPPLTVKDSHGLEQKVEYASAIGAYGNRIYFSTKPYNNDGDYSYYIYYFDLDSEQWVDMSLNFDCISIYSTYIGKYLMVGDNEGTRKTIIDMETGEQVGTLVESEDYPHYFGGDSHLISRYMSNKEEFAKIKCPGNGTNLDNSTRVELYQTNNEHDNACIRPVNETYYMYIDEAGIFMRTYEKGADEEEIVYVFDK